MKPDLITCNNCGKPIVRGKWCSDKCRMAFKRIEPEQKLNPNTNKPEQIEPEHIKVEQPEQKTLRDSLTKCDRTFFDRAMRDFHEPYYIFTDTLRDIICGFCGEKAKTGLSLNKYCSYDHYSKSLRALAH